MEERNPLFHSLPVRRTGRRESDSDSLGVLTARATACLGRVDEDSSESGQKYVRRVVVVLQIGEMRHQMVGRNNAGYILAVIVGSSGRMGRPTRKSVICRTNMAERLIVPNHGNRRRPM